MLDILVAQHGGDGVIAQLRVECRAGAREPDAHRLQLAGDLVGGLLHLGAALRPGLCDRRNQLQERIFRVVRAAEEGPPVGGEEAGHRPAALTGQRDGRIHVDRVQIGSFLAVDLDAHEVVVDGGGDLVVGKRFVGHHMTPVARRVADRQQDRNVPTGGLGQRLGGPLLPVHRVVGVLAQVRTGGPAQGVTPGRHP